MNNIKSLRNFGTIYLWIFVIKVLQVCGDVEYRKDTEANRAAAIVPALLMKPYAYQIFDDDYTDQLLNERNAVATPLWQTLNKQQLYYNSKHGPLITTKINEKNGNSMTSNEITFENLNDLDSYKIKNTIWPKVYNQQPQQQQQWQHHVKSLINSENDNKPQRHSLQKFAVLRTSSGDGSGADKQSTSMTNIRYKQNKMLPVSIDMQKHFRSKATRVSKKSKTSVNDADININSVLGVGVINEGDGGKENLFPLKDDSTLNINDFDDAVWYENENTVGVADFADETNGVANSNGNGNETLSYANINDANTNYMMAQTFGIDHDRDSHDKQQYTRMNINQQIKRIINKPTHDKRAKPSIGHTPFLPAVSGGAMTNLGEFFRDLSKNVRVSEQYQWDDDEQKLLEGDPNFGNIHHHLTKPNAATDQQTAEWIKAIRFYRPSQKIRSLVEMNPHGQWAHSSQFIDPNYMWVGLGK